MSKAPSEEQAATKRGRKAETPVQRLERLQRQVEMAKRVVKEVEQRAFAIVGEAMLGEAESDAELKARIAGILRRRVTTPAQKADIATLLL
jgi:hypothetical protein